VNSRCIAAAASSWPSWGWPRSASEGLCWGIQAQNLKISPFYRESFGPLPRQIEWEESLWESTRTSTCVTTSPMGRPVTVEAYAGLLAVMSSWATGVASAAVIGNRR
jgi:hypothetical protein